MATVWRAYDERLQVYRAVKVMSGSLQEHEVIRTRFMNEARTMARLHHPNIVAVHDIGTDGADSFIVMELVDGGSLMDYLAENGPMPATMAVDATLALLCALQVAHQNGVIHRDIKPQNVLVTSTGRPKVTDFGIAHVVDDSGRNSLTQTGSVMGTWGFMAPEQRVSARKVDARSDLYAVGATLYTLLTNKLPVDLFAADLDEELLAGIDEKLRLIIAKSTKYKPDDRYGSVEEMSQVLEELRRELPELTDEIPKLGSPSRTHSEAHGTLVPDKQNFVVEHTPPKGARPLAGSTMAVEMFSEAGVERKAPPVLTDDAPPADGTLHGLASPGQVTRSDETWDRKPGSRMSVYAGAALMLVALSGMAWWMTQEPEVVAEPPPVQPVVGDENLAETTVPEVTDVEGADPEIGVEEVLTPEVPPPEIHREVLPPIEKDPEPESNTKRETPEQEGPKKAPVGTGVVLVQGDAQSVRLVSGGKSLKPGEVPPGVYQIVAAFGDGDPHPAGSVTVKEDATVTVTCKSAFAACKGK